MSLGDYQFGAQIAYQGQKGCTHPMCRRSPGDVEGCSGWHCANCGKPSSYQGHAKADGTFRCDPKGRA